MFRQFLSRFGSLAAWLGLVDEPTVHDALVSQRESGKRIGQHLEELGHLARGKTETVLRAQRLAQELPRVCEIRFSVQIEDASAEIPVAEIQGVLDGSEESLDALASCKDLPPGKVVVLSLRGLDYLNRRGVEGLMDSWIRNPFVLCEVPELFAILLREMGADQAAPILATREEALAIARVRAKEMPAGELPQPRLRSGSASTEEDAGALDVSVEILDGEILSVRMKGTLGPVTAMRCMKDFARNFEGVSWPLMVLDLTGLSACSNDGLVVLGALPEAPELLIAASPAVRKQLALLGLDQQHSVFSDRERALAAAASEFVAVEGRDVYHKRGCRSLVGSRPELRRYLKPDEVKELRPCQRCLGRRDQCLSCTKLALEDEAEERSGSR
jgi:anti-anti-sigma regulatory factor